MYWRPGLRNVQNAASSSKFSHLGTVAPDNICGQQFVIFHNCATLFACELAQGGPHSAPDLMVHLQPLELSVFPQIVHPDSLAHFNANLPPLPPSEV